MKCFKRLAAGVLVPFLFSVGLFSLDKGKSEPAFSLGRRLPAEAGPVTAPYRDTSLKTISRDFLKDAGQIWSYPVHIKKHDLLPIFLLATSVAILIPNDEGIYRGIKKFRDRHAWVGDVSPVVGQMGFIGAGSVLAAFLSVGLLAKDEKATETALLAGSAMLQSFLVTQVIQGLSGRNVPIWNDGVDHWAGPAAFFARHKNGQGRHYGAFPSGHTATAFCLATVIDIQYGKSVWVPIAAYTVATSVGFAMMAQGEHWFSDVVVGAVVGHVISRMVVNNHRKRHPVQPSVAVGPHGISLGASYSFY